jgi:putative lipoprotein
VTSCYNRHVRLAVLLVILIALVATSARADDGDPWFGRDKALHFSAGAALGAGGYAASTLVFDTRGKRVVSGLVVALGAGAAKEWRDRAGGGNASWRDFTWDGVGAAAGVTIAWLIDRARHAHRTDGRPTVCAPLASACRPGTVAGNRPEPVVESSLR